jgi:predicted flap endonuclease-1-like 5' DNA nuclease
MNFNTALVLIVDGGLFLFFLYALYYSSQVGKKSTKSLIDKEKEDISVVKIKDYEQTYTKKSHTQVPEETVIEPSNFQNEYLESYETRAQYYQHEPEEERIIEQRLRTINIRDIEGIGPVYARRINEVNIFTISDLLERGSTPLERTQIAEETDISPRLILKWINQADLYRIKGIVEEYSDLLEEAGIITINELAQKNPETLYSRLVEKNEEKKLVNKLPSLENIYKWVEEARKLPRRIQY